jgi:hypothetical protein
MSRFCRLSSNRAAKDSPPPVVAVWVCDMWRLLVGRWGPGAATDGCG